MYAERLTEKTGPRGTGRKKSKKPSTKPQIPTATGQPELASTCLCPQEAALLLAKRPDWETVHPGLQEGERARDVHSQEA